MLQWFTHGNWFSLPLKVLLFIPLLVFQLLRALIAASPFIGSLLVGALVLSATGLALDGRLPCALEFIGGTCGIDPEVEERIAAVEKDEALTEQVALAIVDPGQRDLYASLLATHSCSDLGPAVGEALRNTALADETSDWLTGVLTSTVKVPVRSVGDELADEVIDATADVALDEAIGRLTENPDLLRVNVITASASKPVVDGLIRLCLGV